MIHRFGKEFFEIKLHGDHARFLKRIPLAQYTFHSRIENIARVQIHRPKIARVLDVPVINPAYTRHHQFSRPHGMEEKLVI